MTPFPLLFLLWFPCPDAGMALSAAELDAFPPSAVLDVWYLCNGQVYREAKGKLGEECFRIRMGLYRLYWAKKYREEGEDVFAAERYGEALFYCPEWRFAPYRVLMLPYHLMGR